MQSKKPESAGGPQPEPAEELCEERDSSAAAFARLAEGALAADTSGGAEAWILFEQAWPEFVGRVGACLRSRGVSKFLQADCGQEALLRVWRSRATYRGRSVGELSAWIYRIVGHEALRLAEREARAPHSLDQQRHGAGDMAGNETLNIDANDLAVAGDSSPAQALEERDQQRALESCMSELEPELRSVVELLYSSNEPTEREVAACTGHSKSQVNVLRQRALGLLARCLKRKGIL